MKKAKIKFHKYQSEGNNFVIFNDPETKKFKTTKTIRRLCDHHFGVGADGVIFMNQNLRGWNWSFYNADGSRAEMCGNGAKCAALWLKNYGKLAKKPIEWRSAIGPVCAETGKGNLMWVKWATQEAAPNRAIIQELGEVLDGLNERGLAYIASIDAGVPHLVLVNHESWTSTDRSTLNEQFRYHSAFGKPGTNVSWYSLGTGEAVTYERGVEAETLACGTGALAIFRALQDMGRVQTSATLQFPGGNLYVKCDKIQGHWLGGAPQEVFRGELSL